ncbi:ATP-binding protein [Streptomyces sp. NPDC101776]|uniref:ATP-binding protein n=1 Tax=Streptomyces sp. NPDC101776 TaxID=3366146 RepID=UPI0038084441
MGRRTGSDIATQVAAGREDDPAGRGLEEVDFSELVPIDDPALPHRPILSAAAFAGQEPVAEARHAAREFLTRVQAVDGIPVSDRAMGVVELVVSELVTNAHTYAPGPCLMDLEISDGTVKISVWDTDPTLPLARAADPGRVGQHGLEIVIRVCHSFEMRREPVGKRIKAAIMLADDPDDPGGPSDVTVACSGPRESAGAG